MNKKALALCLILISLSGCSTLQSSRSGYSYKINLNEIYDDKLFVELSFSGNLPDVSHFCFPKIVPGIYDALDYRKFISDLEAFDDKGQLLKASRMDENCWTINNSKNITTIRYTVDDSWETFDFKGIRPYRSSESHLDTDVIILNTNAVFGHFSQHEHLPFKISVKKPESFYGATSLTKAKSSKTEDQYIAPNYRALVDSPIMYSQPDIVTLKLPGISVNVASYSTSKEQIANELAQQIAPLVTNQVEYLGGKLATDKYTFIIYHPQMRKTASISPTAWSTISRH